MEKIYLDNAATTRVAPEVREIMNDVYDHHFGNPSSIHSVGQDAKRIVDDGRRLASFFVGCKPDEIIFTSGGSESDNLAIRGVVGAHQGKAIPHIITSATEHHAVLHTVEELEKEGKVTATYLRPDSEGVISPDQVKEAITPNTILVSIIYVNNETGVVLPIREIGLMLEKLDQKIYFHTDAVQAAEFFQIAPEYLKVDLLTFTAHKIHGPKGIGVLYAKKGTPLKHQITGGDQEFRLRAGTENVAAIAGLSKAIDLILHERGDSGNLGLEANLPELMTTNEAVRIMKLRDKLIEGTINSIPDSILNGSQIRRAPGIANISFMNAEGEAVILNLDFLGIQVSSGSACTSRSLDPSHVLSAMGIPPEKAHGSIRFSLSKETTEAEIDKVLEALPKIITKLRDMSPFN
ncbi:MAG: cysteine desulfurase family protein [Candidatus Berkelbacteria bacterium]